MDMDELELRDAGHDHRVYVRRPVQPFHELAHEPWHLTHRRRRVYRLARGGVDYVVLDARVLAGSGGTAPNPRDEPPVYLKYQPFCDRSAVVEIFADVIEGLAIVEKFASVFRVSAGDIAARQDLGGVLHW